MHSAVVFTALAKSKMASTAACALRMWEETAHEMPETEVGVVTVETDVADEDLALTRQEVSVMESGCSVNPDPSKVCTCATCVSLQRKLDAMEE